MELVLTAKKHVGVGSTLKVQDGPLKGKTARVFDFDEAAFADPEKTSPPLEFCHTLLIAADGSGLVELDVDRERHMKGGNVIGKGGIHIEGTDARTFENSVLTVIDFTSQTESRYSFIMNNASGAVELWRR